MSSTLRNAVLAAALVGLSSACFGALGEVYWSDNVWYGKVDGSQKYSGSSSKDAEVACVNAMSSGTILIKNDAPSGAGMWTKTNVIIDAGGRTLGGGGTTGAISASNCSNIGARNVRLTSTNWYGIYFRTCNGQNCSGTYGTANKTFRIDNCKGGTGYNLTLSSPSDSGVSGSRDSDNVETYGISGGSAGTITCNDRANGCGTLLNYSSNFTISTNNATRCDFDGGYAGFRTANTNGKTTISNVNSTSCGRGYFSVSGSRDCTVSALQTYTTGSTGVWLQTTYNTRVNSGTVRAGNGCSAISAGSGNTINVTCQ